MNIKARRKALAALALAVAGISTGIAEASVPDIAYQRYLHFLDSASPLGDNAGPQGEASTVATEADAGYRNYLRYLDAGSVESQAGRSHAATQTSTKGTIENGYAAYQRHLGWS